MNQYAPCLTRTKVYFMQRLELPRASRLGTDDLYGIKKIKKVCISNMCPIYNTTFSLLQKEII